MENLKPALEKLFNTLGNQMTDDYYGKTFDFKVNEIKSFDDGYVQIYVSTTPNVPETLYVEDSPWSYGKFSDAGWLAANLTNLTKYIGIGNGLSSVNIETVDKTEDYPTGDKFNFCDYEDDFYRFDSNGTVLHIPSGYTYPIYNDLCSFDPYDGYHLSDIESDDWWDALTENEKRDLVNFYK